jgi:hypothetical protein
MYCVPRSQAGATNVSQLRYKLYIKPGSAKQIYALFILRHVLKCCCFALQPVINSVFENEIELILLVTESQPRLLKAQMDDCELLAHQHTSIRVYEDAVLHSKRHAFRQHKLH